MTGDQLWVLSDGIGSSTLCDAVQESDVENGYVAYFSNIMQPYFKMISYSVWYLSVSFRYLEAEPSVLLFGNQNMETLVWMRYGERIGARFKSITP